ncbi:MAG: PD-(D/E)XK nuclease family protein [Filifactoraceae bacterium]
MLRLMYGSDMNSIKSKIMEEVKTLSKDNKEIYLIVPEMFSYASEMQVMNFLNLKSMINIKVMSFQRLTETVLTKLGGIKRQRIDDVGKSLIIRKLISEEPESYKLYNGMIDKDGFYSKLISLVKELKSNLIYPNVIKDISDYCNKDLLKEKLLEISKLYEGMDKYLEYKYVDNEDRLNQLNEVLSYNNTFSDMSIIFWQFSGFSQLEYNIIRSICKMNGKVTFGLVFDERDEKKHFATTKYTREKLIEIAGDLCIDVEEINIHEKCNEPEYRYFVGSNIDEEISVIAGKIRLLLDQGVDYKEIALIVGSEEYTILIRRIFGEFNLPILINSKEVLMTTAVASWIKSMFRVVINGFKYEDVMMFLKSRLNIFSFDDIQVFENFILRKNIRGEMYFREKYFIEDNFFDEEEAQRVNKVRNYIVEGFKDLKSLKRSKMSVKSLVKEFFIGLDRFNFIDMIDAFLDELEGEGLLKEVEIVEQSYSSIIDIVDQMVEILGEISVDFQEFSSLLESGFKQKRIGAIPQGDRYILVSDVREGLSGDYKYIFFLGANNENFPCSKKDSGLLSDQELREINMDKFEFRTYDIIDLEEYHNIYKLLTFPEKMVIFSYPNIGIRGDKQKPSIYIKDSNSQPLNISEAWEFRLDPMLYKLSDIVRTYVEYNSINENEIYLLKQAKVTKTLQDKVNKVLLDESLDKSDFNIEKSKLRLLYTDPLALSVTRIHKISNCEFAHFIKYGLVPREREVSRIEPREIGTLLHGFVEKFSMELKENPNIFEYDESMIEKLIDKVYYDKVNELLDKEALDSGRNIYLLKKIKRSANTLGKLFIKQSKNSEFKLYEQEVAFGENQRFPKLNLNGENYSAFINGTIDKVDIYEIDGSKYVRIIDYKTAGKVFSFSDTYNILDVQLLIYMAAALGSDKNINPGGAFYFPLMEKQLLIEDNEFDKIQEKREESYRMDGIGLLDESILGKMDINFGEKDSSIRLRGRGGLEDRDNLLSRNQFIGFIEHVKSEILNKLDNLFEGKVRVNPYIKESRDSGCKYCKYKSICGFDERLNQDRFRKILEYDVASIKRKIGGGE